MRSRTRHPDPYFLYTRVHCQLRSGPPRLSTLPSPAVPAIPGPHESAPGGCHNMQACAAVVAHGGQFGSLLG